MKKFLTYGFLLCLVLLPDISLAQLEIKPAIGINFTDFSDDPASGETSAKVGWQIGGTVLMGDKLYGEGGIFWTYKSNEYNSDDDQITFNTEISGIRIPAIIGYYLLKKEATLIGLRAFGGASVLIVTTVDAFELTKDDFNSANWGVFLGAGLDISMFFVDLKYEWSLTDVSSVSTFDVGKSRSIFINAGVSLSL
ncbi:MAG: outer membrane beta-barrel protein [Ignavibacteriaceae bacterium]|nr:outer membrane beta-barrel protein [Ignavibacteriaceae bacterium]